jgi:diaminohydroxyphosphoribosylaminopyrimidine deaminase / 5-amino-6-(5-phosphoribosylamino)uracil reductase
LHGALVTAGLVDRLVAYVSPKILGPGGLPAFRASGVETIADAEAWRLLSATPIDDDVRLEYEPEDG